MRTVTWGELTAMLASRVGHHLKVEIRNSAGTWVDYASLGGVDWVDAVSVNTETIDQPVGTAQIQLRRRAHNLRLAPFYGSSSLNTGSPALDLGRRVRIGVAVKDPGVAPTGGDWRYIFHGRVDAIAWEQDPIVLDCSDDGAWLLDLQIEAERDYVRLELTAADYGTLTVGTNSIVFSGADPRTLKGGLREGDTVALLFMPNNANNRTVTIASLNATTIFTVETLTANASPTAAPTLSRQSTAVEYVMQSLIDDNVVNAGLGAVSLYVPVSPGWQVRAYKQERTRLLEALRSLALQIGWEVRYRYDASNNHRLTFFEPPRFKQLSFSATATGYARTTGSFVDEGYQVGDVVWGVGFTNSVNNGPHTLTAVTALALSCTGTAAEVAAPARSLVRVGLTLGPQHYSDVTRLNIALADVRNVVTGRYISEAGNLGSATQRDTASISKHGRRYMEIAEEATSNINTQTEMQQLVDAAVNDLSEPKADQEVNVYLLWPLQFGDFLQFLANDEHYDTPQGFSVVGVNHQFANGEGWTTIQTRGKAAGSYADWLRRESTLLESALLPNPTITAEAEATAQGGSGDGRVRLKIKFDALTKEVYVYTLEGGTANLPAPEQTANRLAGVVARQEGTIASATEWETEFDIGTTATNYRKVVAIPVGFSTNRVSGRQGTPRVFELQAVDTGTGPSAGTSALSVNMTTANGVAKAELSWTNGDSNAEIRVYRNGFVLRRCAPGTTFLVDDNLTPGSSYTYRVEAVRSAQTAAPTTVASETSDPLTLDTPTGLYASGGLPANEDGYYFVGVGFSLQDPLAQHEIQMSPTTDPGDAVLVDTLAPSTGSATLRHDVVGATPGTTYYFRVRAVRTGYTSSAWTGFVSSTFGLAS